MPMASPRSNSMVISVGVSGASSGRMVRCQTISSGASQGSSRILPSLLECSRLASTLKGDSPRLSLAIGIWCASAKAISAVRLVRSHSRQGAMILMSGFRE